MRRLVFGHGVHGRYRPDGHRGRCTDGGRAVRREAQAGLLVQRLPAEAERAEPLRRQRVWHWLPTHRDASALSLWAALVAERTPDRGQFPLTDIWTIDFAGRAARRLTHACIESDYPPAAWSPRPIVIPELPPSAYSELYGLDWS
jgi:hypothetical protein